MFTDNLSDRQKAIAVLTLELTMRKLLLTHPDPSTLTANELREALRSKVNTARYLLDVAAQVVVDESAR